jgi:hypothetical protein
MIKTKTEYCFKKGDEMFTVEVNEECDHLDYKPVLVKETNCWRSIDGAIEHYLWIFNRLKKLEKELNKINT